MARPLPRGGAKLSTIVMDMSKPKLAMNQRLRNIAAIGPLLLQIPSKVMLKFMSSSMILTTSNMQSAMKKSSNAPISGTTISRMGFRGHPGRRLKKVDNTKAPNTKAQKSATSGPKPGGAWNVKMTKSSLPPAPMVGSEANLKSAKKTNETASTGLKAGTERWAEPSCLPSLGFGVCVPVRGWLSGSFLLLFLPSAC